MCANLNNAIQTGDINNKDGFTKGHGHTGNIIGIIAKGIIPIGIGIIPIGIGIIPIGVGINIAVPNMVGIIGGIGIIDGVGIIGAMGITVPSIFSSMVPKVIGCLRI